MKEAIQELSKLSPVAQVIVPVCILAAFAVVLYWVYMMYKEFND